jgi:hypothetical protein
MFLNKILIVGIMGRMKLRMTGKSESSPGLEES